MAPNLIGFLRIQELLAVATTAAELGLRVEAEGWLAEVEAQLGQFPEVQRRQPLGQLAAAWVTLDAARAEKVLAGIQGDADSWDLAVTQVIERLVRREPDKAIAWVERFKQPGQSLAQSYRARVATRLADRDLARAVQLAEGLSDPVYRGGTFARLATAVYKENPKLSQGFIDKAAAALTAPDSEEDDHEDRLGVAVYLLWQDEEGDLHEWVLAVALVAPAAALHLTSEVDVYTAEAVLAVLERRSSVIERLELIERLWWMRSGDDAPPNDD
jgi:hypothetical protein